MDAAELKAAALLLLDGGTAWCQGANARDSAGVFCPIGSPDAVSWDIYGAMVKSMEPGDQASFSELYADLSSSIPGSFKSRDIEAWNDEANWGDVASFLAP